jgi:acyl carrier protein
MGGERMDFDNFVTRKVTQMTDRAQIRQTLTELIENDMGEKYDNLEDGRDLRNELGLDSVDVVSIVSQIERHFRIRLTHQELENLATVGDLLNLLEAKVSAPPVNTAAA